MLHRDAAVCDKAFAFKLEFRGSVRQVGGHRLLGVSCTETAWAWLCPSDRV